MIHARKDYNRIQDPKGLIGEEEPVFLLRAKDRLAPNVVRYWAILLKNYGGDKDLVLRAEQWASKMEEWQKEHECKIPDAPKEAF